MRDAESLKLDTHGASTIVEKAGSRRDGSDGRPAPTFGTVFVLAGDGVRHMGRPTGRPGRVAAVDGTFLGYSRENLFWKDLLDLVHPDEAEGFEALISDVKASPCTSASVELRLLDGAGRWRLVEATVLNVLEVPDGLDGGLLVVNVRNLPTRETEDGAG